MVAFPISPDGSYRPKSQISLVQRQGMRIAKETVASECSWQHKCTSSFDAQNRHQQSFVSLVTPRQQGQQPGKCVRPGTVRLWKACYRYPIGYTVGTTYYNTVPSTFRLINHKATSRILKSMMFLIYMLIKTRSAVLLPMHLKPTANSFQNSSLRMFFIVCIS